MSLPAWSRPPPSPAWLLVSLLAMALPPFALLLHGPAAFALVLLGPATLLVVWQPLFLVAIPLLIAPLLGRTSEDSIGPFNAMALLALWVAGVGGIAAVTRWRELLRERLFAPALALVLLIAISVIVSSRKADSLQEVIRSGSAVMMLLVVYLYARRQRQRQQVVACVLLSAACPLVVGFYQLLTGDVDYGQSATLLELESGITRIYSTFWDVHPYAKYLLVIAPVALVLALCERRSLAKSLAYFSFFAIVVVSLTFTYARSQIIGLGLAGALTLYRLGRLRPGLVLALLPVLAVFAYATGVVGRFADVLQPLDLASGDRENSLESRLLIWVQGMHLALQRPLLGHGAATFELDMGIESHNVYLGLFYELGAFGPLLYLAFLWFALRYASAGSRAPGIRPEDRQVATAVYGITGAIAVVSAVENYAQATTMWWAYFALLGCVAAALREAHEYMPPDTRVSRATADAVPASGAGGGA